MKQMNSADSNAIVDGAYDRMETPKKRVFKTVEPETPVKITRVKAKLPRDVKWQ